MTGPVEIVDEMVGDVAVLHVTGRLTIGEPSEILSDCLARFVSAGQKKILVDFGGVAQIDSSGIATIVRISIALHRNGGSLKLAVEPGRVNDALIVTRLVEAIDTFRSIEEALAAFSAAPFYCFCPVCGSRSEPPSRNQKSLYWEPQTCSHCDSQFTLNYETPVQKGVVLEKIKIFPYGNENEYVEILPGSPVHVNVVGRLDLFSSRALDNALRAISTPRRVAINLGSTTDISDAGRDALLALLVGTGKNDKIVVSLEGLNPDRLEPLSNLSKSIHSTQKVALAALGRVPKKSKWLIRVERA